MQALFVQIQAAEDYVVFKKMMEKRNLELNQQAMGVLQQRSAPPVLKDAMTSAAESKEKEAEEEELQEALRKSKEEFDGGLSRGLSVEEREMEEEELQQALRRSMEEYNQSQITTAQQQPPPSESRPPASRHTHPEPSLPVSSPSAGSISPDHNTSAIPLDLANGASSQAPDLTPADLQPSSHSPVDSPGSRVPLPQLTVSAPPAVRTGADAAAEWLASARAEGNKTSIPAAPVAQSLVSYSENVKNKSVTLIQYPLLLHLFESCHVSSLCV